MKSAIFVVSILLIGILLFGCTSTNNTNYVTNNTNNNGENNVNVQPNVTEPTGPGVLDFSMPSELPIAYIGKPFTYSVNPTGGRTPYEFDFEFHQTAYDGHEVSTYLSGFSYSKDNKLLNFTPHNGDEGKYSLKICAGDQGNYYYKHVCKNTTLYIMSDNVTVKGNGTVTSSVVWDPRAYIVVRGRAGDVEKTLEGPDRTTLVPLSDISSVSLNVSTPPKDSNPGSKYSLGSSGGASMEFEMVANSTSVSQSVIGDAPCGSPRSDGSYEPLNVDTFQVLKETVIGLNITNDGTTEKVVDISFAGRSAISSDSKHYYVAGTEVNIFIGDAKFDLNPFPYTIPDLNETALNPGEEVTDSKVIRVVVVPGSHVVQIGVIDPSLDGSSGCPSHVSISSGVTITAVDADLSDGKKPTARIYAASIIEKIK